MIALFGENYYAIENAPSKWRRQGNQTICDTCHESLRFVFGDWRDKSRATGITCRCDIDKLEPGSNGYLGFRAAQTAHVLPLTFSHRIADRENPRLIAKMAKMAMEVSK